MLSTVAGQQPRSAPIDCLERPTAVIRMIVALRKTLTSMVENRSLSNASQSSGRSFHAAMTSSVQLRETDQLHEVYKKTNYRPMYYPYALSWEQSRAQALKAEVSEKIAYLRESGLAARPPAKPTKRLPPDTKAYLQVLKRSFRI